MTLIEKIEPIARKAGLWPLRGPQSRCLTELDQGRNLLLVWPTGSGKSACYQLPALAEPGLSLVVSPLIALMDDQVAKARSWGWPATCVHSNIKKADREQRLARVTSGDVRLLYVTPERFRQPEFMNLVRTRGVRFLAVDEAHCISQWGQDFRPDYSRLGQIREDLGSPPTVALTATATREVQADILKQLRLSDENTTVMWEGLERPNLFLAAEECEDFDDKMAALTRSLRTTTGAKIVYFTLIRSLEMAAHDLAREGFVFENYHGDMERGPRTRAQARFLNGEVELMLATPAFGLGIDKPDVRGVFHVEPPASLEAYFQEVGRAGRDGQPSQCRLFYWQEDLTTQMKFIDNLTPDPTYLRAVYSLLELWKDRLSTLQLEDLRAQLSFKNKHDHRLETALNTLERLDVISWPGRRLNKLEITRPLSDDDVSLELWTARRLSLQKKLLAVVQWFRSTDCRKVQIYRYFGWPNETRCGFCDRCEDS